MERGYDYFFSQSGLFVVPVEYLSSDGIAACFREEIVRREAMPPAAVKLLHEAWKKYWRRAELLFNTSPQYWFPPRAQHLCIVTDEQQVRPYSQPFNKTSWLLYQQDFDPGSSSLEFAIYQFLHVERMWLMQQVDRVLYANLSYLLVLNPEQQQQLRAGCLANNRPDADGFRALAAALPWINKLLHKQLKPASDDLSVTFLADSGLHIPADHRQQLVKLLSDWSAVAVQAQTRYQQLHNSPAPAAGRAITDWLEQHQPQLVITGESESALWHPEVQDSTALVSHLSDISASVADSILQDLRTIDQSSQQFTDRLLQPESLAAPADYMTAGGLCHIHPTRQQITYSLNPELHPHRLSIPAQPYERLMLAARCMHEWGHLAAESGWVNIPDCMQSQWDQTSQRLERLFEEIHQLAPPAVRHRAAPEVQRLQTDSGSLGQALLRKMLIRVEDFQANLVASELLPAAAMQTYVRNNVYAHWQEYSTDGLYVLLLRYAYEFQYLRFTPVADPMRWFLSSTWFGEHYLQRRILPFQQFEQLTLLIGRLCDCFSIDNHKIQL